MNYKIHLIQDSRTGKQKQLIIEVAEGSNEIYREWGLVGHKQQSQVKEVQGKHIGKSNETDPNEQAVIEAKAIAVRKIKEGYRDVNDTAAQEKSKEFTFHPLPRNFAPSKPKNNPPKGVTFNGGYDDYFWERKNNGVNLLSVCAMDGSRYDYTRGIGHITDIIADVTPIQEFKQIPVPPGTIISYEFVAYNNEGREVPKDLKGIVSDRTSPAKSKARYEKLLALGYTFAIKVFDVLFYDGNNVTKKDYLERRKILENLYFKSNPQYASVYGYTLKSTIIEYAINNNWEGFVLRDKEGDKSHVEFTMNGKPHRCGAYKFKFEWEDDYIVYEAKVGDSGRLRGKLAHLHLGKYDKNGEIVEICWAGPGNIKGEDLDKAAEELGIDPTDMNPGTVYPTVLQTALVKFQSKQIGTNALEFPVVKYLRDDKPVTECLLQDSPKLLAA